MSIMENDKVNKSFIGVTNPIPNMIKANSIKTTAILLPPIF